jgi:hypothetical protein
LTEKHFLATGSLYLFSFPHQWKSWAITVLVIVVVFPNCCSKPDQSLFELNPKHFVIAHRFARFAFPLPSKILALAVFISAVLLLILSLNHALRYAESKS